MLLSNITRGILPINCKSRLNTWRFTAWTSQLLDFGIMLLGLSILTLRWSLHNIFHRRRREDENFSSSLLHFSVSTSSYTNTLNNNNNKKRKKDQPYVTFMRYVEIQLFFRAQFYYRFTIFFGNNRFQNFRINPLV